MSSILSLGHDALHDSDWQSEKGLCGVILRQTKFVFDFGNFLFGVNKEAAAIHVLLTRSLFGSSILRRLLPRVSLAKSTSAPVRF